MYPFASVRRGADQLWSAIHAQLPWTPDSLDWEVDLHDSWRRADLVVGHTCGWPLVTQLLAQPPAGRVQVIGAFHPDVAGAHGPAYRSAIVAREPADPVELRGRIAAVNSRDSLSGMVSLLVATTPAGERPPLSWPGEVRFTGAHLDSLLEVRDGHADIASIDAVTLALVRREQPDVADGLVEIGSGPLVPSLPVIAGASVSASHLDELRRTFEAVVDDPELASARTAMLVRGFSVRSIDDYLPLLELLPGIP
jgi:ABC-type phosphate/phosphonate transport system substrate-binding protein